MNQNTYKDRIKIVKERNLYAKITKENFERIDNSLTFITRKLESSFELGQGLAQASGEWKYVMSESARSVVKDNYLNMITERAGSEIEQLQFDNSNMN